MTVFLVILGGLAILLLWGFAFVKGTDAFDYGDGSDWALFGVILLSAVAATAGAIMWVTAHGGDGDGFYEWRGGNGPDTHCHYETRQGPSVLVGKIMVPGPTETWTVCR